MKKGLMRFQDDHGVAVPCVKRTESFLERTKGLLGSQELVGGEGLLIIPCNSVHTLFMQFSIDVVFLDKQSRVNKIVRGMKPFNFALALRACAVLELPAGDVDRIGIVLGQCLLWEEE